MPANALSGPASGVAVDAATEITLKGSTDIVSEFFTYAINSILYQRGLYPPRRSLAPKSMG